MSCGSFYINHLEGDAWWGMLPPLSTLKKGGVSMKEEWKPVDGYEGCYLISSFGRVISLKRHGVSENHILVPKINNKGYLFYDLWNKGNNKTFLAHRLVAMHFIDNPNGYSFVNHIDENPFNNSVENLEWCDHLYNVNYSLDLHPERRRKSSVKSSSMYRIHDKSVIQISMDGDTLMKYNSPIDCAKENGFNEWSIIQCCEGKRKTAYGFKWQYSN